MATALPVARPARRITRRSIAQRAAEQSVIFIDLTASPIPDVKRPKVSPLEPKKEPALPVKQESKDLYEKLKELEESSSVVNNPDEFICNLCNLIIKVNQGIVARECVHYTCINCIREHILTTKTVDVNCPIAGCESSLQDREIRSLLTQNEYAIHVNSKVDYDENDADGDLYEKLKLLEDQSGYIQALGPFNCGVCITDTDAEDGVTIRDCLHQFCVDCIRGTINNSDDAVVKCPEDGCECEIQSREIRSLLTQAEFDKYLLKTLRIAETVTANSFHCKKPDCLGWAICEDEVNFFRCPICQSVNCLACQAIHPGKNCLQHQEDIKNAELTDDERSQKTLDQIVEEGSGMRCPKCQIVIMKRDGCDGLTCVMCRTELCWATKMARWGPKGHGDTSGGCQCRINGKKCHPNCRNCH